MQKVARYGHWVLPSSHALCEVLYKLSLDVRVSDCAGTKFQLNRFICLPKCDSRPKPDFSESYELETC